jgi:WD40 repeat protein
MEEEEGTSMEQESGIRGLAVTRDGTNIISCDVDGKIKVWDVGSHEIVKEWTHPERCPEMAISPDDRLVAVGDLSVAIYTMEGRQVNDSIEADKVVWSMCFSPDGKKLARGTRDDIRVYDVDSGTLILGRYGATDVRSVVCCGRATAASSSLPRTTIQSAVGTPTRENKSDIRGQAIPTTYSPSPSPQMDQSLRVRPGIKLFGSGIQLLVTPLDNTYSMIKQSTKFVSLPPANSWYQ